MTVSGRVSPTRPAWFVGAAYGGTDDHAADFVAKGIWHRHQSRWHDHRQPGDGQTVRVDWAEPGPAREWYYFTNRATVWRVDPGDWRADGLIAFAFQGKPQDIELYRNAGE